jgi:hypothetical protein
MQLLPIIRRVRRPLLQPEEPKENAVSPLLTVPLAAGPEPTPENLSKADHHAKRSRSTTAR